MDARTKIDPRMWELPAGQLPPLLLRPEQAAQILSMSRWKVFELIRLGELRSVKSGGSRRIPVAAVREYVSRLESVEVGA
ncbi:helix-turn-helix domain-containing protein [Natronosporangium hydrolyticum]|uniref:Helix-turn-helix domain-containing protein n=1 Tax=Natronosporangium hydrolyticum TaxID=2811111 RepID=A0A895YMN6_9ACTN|nr:helix-turn-helix domain-containing protein [Natronosporangium hydrolyticum]QSB15168.1 helix-turn-helix domain-containing protein [Natronosporangium hydrolyticum]